MGLGAQSVDDGAEDEVLGLLVSGKLRERHDAGVFLLFGIFDRAVLSSVFDLLGHPAFMTGLGAGVLSLIHGAFFLPVRGQFPGLLAHVAKGFAVGAVYFMANAGNFARMHGYAPSFPAGFFKPLVAHWSTNPSMGQMRFLMRSVAMETPRAWS